MNKMGRKKESNGQQVTVIKPWSEMTEAEIIQLKRQQCKKNAFTIPKDAALPKAQARVNI